MNTDHDLLRRRAEAVSSGLPRITDATVVSGHGAILIDAEGNELIDFAGGIGVMTVGHSEPSVVRAIQEQAARLQHVCIHVATYEPYVALCERLVTLFPHGERTKALLVNSGAEAVENAVKIARQATRRPSVICFTESFHGRTLLAATLTSKVGYKSHCGPFAPAIHRLPFPNFFRDHDGLDERAFVRRELDRLRRFFVSTVEASDVAAIILEVVQGEGGFIVAPRTYLQGLRTICDEHGIVLIFDEVQSGFCRTGRWAAYEHFDVTPDLSTWAKAMGGGLPIASVIGRAEVMDAVKTGTIGGTYGGNPVACAAALAAIDVMERLDLNSRAAAIGERLRERFERLRQRVPSIIDVRGLGAMIAIELAEDGDPSRPATSMVAAVIKACVSRGLIVVPAGSYGNNIRILCPLVITDEQLDRGLTILEDEITRHAGGAVRPLVPAETRAVAGHTHGEHRP